MSHNDRGLSARRNMGVTTTGAASAAVRRAAMSPLVLGYPSCLVNTHCGGPLRILRHEWHGQDLRARGPESGLQR